jgi:predicted Rossmann-fold nucleotide-binding protein
LNTAGFFGPLVSLLRHTIAHDLAAPEHERLVVVQDDPKALLDALFAWTPPPLGEKWTDRR